MQFAERKLIIDDHRQIAYQVYQTPKARLPLTVVFLHGLGSSGAAWHPIINSVGQTTQMTHIINVDCLGHGLSSRPSQVKAYSFDLLADDIIAVIKQETSDRVVLVGHCLGSILAQIIASKDPRLIKKMILINTTSEGTLGLFKLLWLIYPLLRFATSFLPTWHRVGRYDYARFHHTADVSLIRLAYDLVFTSLKSYLVCGLNAMQFHTPSRFFNQVVPTVVVAGQCDSIYPSSYGRVLAGRINQAKFFEMPGVNHISPINGVTQLSQILNQELES